MNTLHQVKEMLQSLSDKERKAFSPKFFKAGKGEYAEGDLFIGVTVPNQRLVVKEFWKVISEQELSELLQSKYHEHRLTALLMLVAKFEKTKKKEEQEHLVDFYLSHKEFINNWDLVDSSCYKILGKYAFENNLDTLLIQLSKEDNMWSKRIAIVSTMHYVKKGEYDLLKELVLYNLHHSHDLIHKANGWLLREMGEKDQNELLDFLKKHYQNMPRTTLRYAIEKLEPELRKKYLKGEI